MRAREDCAGSEVDTIIRDKLIPLLVEKFGANSFNEGSAPAPIATFPAASQDVGNLEIFDDGDELIVSVGTLTHGHFGFYEEGATQETKQQEVAEAVLDFVKDVFAGKYIFYSNGMGGGWKHIDYLGYERAESENLKAFYARLELGANWFNWHGPIAPPTKDG